jgi:circadian clock protein KaiA
MSNSSHTNQLVADATVVEVQADIPQFKTLADTAKFSTMSDSLDNPAKLCICLFTTQKQLSDSVSQLLKGDRYELRCLNLVQELTDFVVNNSDGIDCLVLSANQQLDKVFDQLWQSEILLPTIIVEAEQPINNPDQLPGDSTNSSVGIKIPCLYHQAEIRLYLTQLTEISSYINLAISKFISLAPSVDVSQNHDHFDRKAEKVPKSLVMQQRRLTDKLKERLGYLGFYYKRNQNDFYRNLSKEEQNELNQKLSQSYRLILLDYFDDNSQVNKLIDEFVDRAFFADISTSQILEIHMEQIDDFSQQLKLEGRNDDILLDYRLPLIDVISHLCEMYRRSIPGKDISLELLFTVE